MASENGTDTGDSDTRGTGTGHLDHGARGGANGVRGTGDLGSDAERPGNAGSGDAGEQPAGSGATGHADPETEAAGAASPAAKPAGSDLSVRLFRGPAIAPLFDDLAALRIAVFADFPYLYDGDLDYERRYLGRFAAAPGAFVVGAFDGARLVGAATSAPMEQHEDDFAAPLAAAGIAPETVYYCAESVLLPAYRGRGLGHRFFDAREAEARRLGRRHAAFCAVIRPADHPARPEGYRPLDPFWRARGYAPLEGAVARFAWRDRGEVRETEKPLQLWIRAL